MESDDMEHFVDLESDDCNSYSWSDDSEENETKEANTSNNEEATKFKSVLDLSASDIMNM